MKYPGISHSSSCKIITIQVSLLLLFFSLKYFKLKALQLFNFRVFSEADTCTNTSALIYMLQLSALTTFYIPNPSHSPASKIVLLAFITILEQLLDFFQTSSISEACFTLLFCFY